MLAETQLKPVTSIGYMTKPGISSGEMGMRFSPEIAKRINGRNNWTLCVLLLQLDYWIAHPESVKPGQVVLEDGYWWLVISTRQMAHKLQDSISPSTLNGHINDLEQQHLIAARPGKRRDDPRWIRLDQEGCIAAGIPVFSYWTPPCAEIVHGPEASITGVQKSHTTNSVDWFGVRLSYSLTGSSTDSASRGVQFSDTLNNDDGDDQNTLSLLSNHHHRVREAALKQAGVQPPSWKYFEGWSAEEVDHLAEEAKEQPGLNNPAGWMVRQAMHPATLSLIQQEIEARRQFEAMLKQRQKTESLSTEECAQIEILREAANRDYEAKRTEYDALLAQAERVEPKSRWWKAWFLTINSSLHAQLHKATLNSWIVGSEAVGLLTDGGKQFLVVRVSSRNAQEWLDQRLYGLMQGVLATNSGQPDIQIKFISEPVLHQPFEFQPLPDGIPGLTELKTALGESAASFAPAKVAGF